MINFDEAIKQFHPSLEINEVEQAVKKENSVEDITDIMLEIMNKAAKKGK
jgi:hypothetical protein